MGAERDPRLLRLPDDPSGVLNDDRVGRALDRLFDADRAALASGIAVAAILNLAEAQWVAAHRNVLIVGPTGVGKKFLACALAQAALRRGHRALYLRVPRLLDELVLARADGRLPRLLAAWAKVDVLVLDDLALQPLTPARAADLLEVVEDRHGLRSTIITSQLPVGLWHEALGEPTLADAILDRLVHNAYRIDLRGDSLRRPEIVGDGADGASTATNGSSAEQPAATQTAQDARYDVPPTTQARPAAPHSRAAATMRDYPRNVEKEVIVRG